MIMRTSFVCLVAAITACAPEPPPQDLSNASVPIRNSAAQVENIHAVTEVTPSPAALEVLGQSDRAAGDRSLDGPRQAAEVLTYLAVSPGMRVAELAAGGGYLTELLARSVGTSGVVHARNPASLVAHAPIGPAMSDRLARPVNARVTTDGAELAAPLPQEARGLDLVYLGFFYRDLPAVGADRRLLLAGAYDALRPGGRFVVIDRATPQQGARLDLRAVHVEESRNARYEIERAGFHFVNEGRFLRGSTEPTDWRAAPSDSPTALETQDRFFLTFVK
jgi:predicted methyltransferase